ncbi:MULTISPECIES: RNA polymerase sigma factor [unclassified Sphingopyxis]|uniref:RNA polymerase sigma factor n=1 Tax=unclassified Sphingopyxis TaxID=2614943 RepID=UPI00214C0892|nr:MULTISPECIES: RNA polymerase sigma factor [unclassified Sphingopyxis]
MSAPFALTASCSLTPFIFAPYEADTMPCRKDEDERAQRLMNRSGGLEAIFMANRPALSRYLRVRLRGDGDGEDILQELWLKLAGIDASLIAEPLAYLYRTAENLVLDRRRSAQRRIAREQEWTKGHIDGSMAAPRDAQPSAERMLVARDQLRRVDAVLDALPERTAFAFRAVRIDGVPQKQIAAQMGISVSAVEKHLQRGYRAVLELKQQLDVDIDAPQRQVAEGIDDGDR